jgi:hypothetical protein
MQLDGCDGEIVYLRPRGIALVLSQQAGTNTTSASPFEWAIICSKLPQCVTPGATPRASQTHVGNGTKILETAYRM